MPRVWNSVANRLVFGGLSAEEAAEVLALSEITIKREWLKAKAWLYHELSKTVMTDK
jgi:hypothetical protein